MNIYDSKKVDCFICSGNDTELIHKSKLLDGDLCVSICKNDGLVYLTPRWPNEVYERYYKRVYDETYRPDLNESHSEEHKYSTSIVIENRLKKAGKLRFKSMLDIGCGMGWALKYFSKSISSDLSLHAIEASDVCVANLHAQGKIKIISRNVESDWQVGYEGKFDFILMRHVVEHFLDPVKVLQKVAETLTNDGIVYIAVPNMMKPKLQLAGYWFRPAHVYYFSPETLRYCAALAGLKAMVLEESENSEIWGIFTKTDVSPDKFISVYEQQLSAIVAQRNKLRWTDVISTLKCRVLNRLNRNK